MHFFRSFTSQQWVITACGAAFVAGIILSHGGKIGFLPLAIAVAAGLAALARSRRR